MIKKLFSPKTPLQIAAATIVSVLATVSVVAAATTLGTNLSTTGTFTVTPASNSTTEVSIKNAASTPIFDVDTTNGLASTTDFVVNSGARIGIGSSGGHLTALANDSLFVEGEGEFDGIVWFDGSLRASSTILATGATTLYNTLTATTTSLRANDSSAAVLTIRQDDATSNIATLQDGATSVLTIGPTGLVVVQPSANSVTALSVKNATGLPIFDVDTTNSRASTTALTVNGALIASSTLDVTGATTLYNTLTATTTNITANDSSAAVLTVRQNDATSNIATLQDGATAVLTVGPAGLVVVQPSANSVTALSVKNATGLPIFDVDTTNSRASTTEIIVPQSNANTPRFNASSTAVSIGDGSPITGVRFGTCDVNVPALGGANASSSIATCSAVGVDSTYRIFVNANSSSSAFTVLTASSSASGTIQIGVGVMGHEAVNPDTSTWDWMAIK